MAIHPAEEILKEKNVHTKIFNQNKKNVCVLEFQLRLEDNVARIPRKI